MVKIAINEPYIHTNRFKILLYIFLFIFLAPAGGVPVGIDITDEAGITVSVPLNPRVVCLSAASAETVYALNASHLIVGRTETCTIPPELEKIPSLGSIAGEVDAESILATGAGLVISGVPPISAETERSLKSAGIPVLHYNALYVDTILPMIEDLSLILNREREADELKDFIKRYQNLINERIADISAEDRPKVYFMSMGDFYQTAGSDSTGNKRIEMAGGYNIGRNLTGIVPAVDAEWIIDKNPEVIVYSIRPDQYRATFPRIEEMAAKRDEIAALPGFDRIDAVKSGRVHVIDIGTLSGPRGIVGLLYLASWFYPDRFTDVDPAAVHEEMLRDFYHLNWHEPWAYPMSQSA
ncbi:MAG: ABC transporter substrate-binding protein [Methanothrix sp.]|uniref:ABC transporter substrate-binding protein n=2 Tax=Methanothrix sp. TaxID=90426 RepID=UPI003BB814EC